MQDLTKPTALRYSEEFKRQLVNRVLKGESVTNVARETRISQPSINRWMREFGVYDNSKVIDTKAVDKTEVEELKRQIKELNDYITKLERHIISGIIKDAPFKSIDKVNILYGNGIRKDQ